MLRRATLVVSRVDEPGVLAVWPTHRGMKAHRRDIKGDGCAEVVKRHTRPGLQLGMRRCQLRLHHRGPLHGEPLRATGRRGKLNHDRPGGPERWSVGELGPHACRVDPYRGVPSRIDPDLRPGRLESLELGENAIIRLCASRRQRKRQTDSNQRDGGDRGDGEPDLAWQRKLLRGSMPKRLRLSHYRATPATPPSPDGAEGS